MCFLYCRYLLSEVWVFPMILRWWKSIAANNIRPSLRCIRNNSNRHGSYPEQHTGIICRQYEGYFCKLASTVRGGVGDLFPLNSAVYSCSLLHECMESGIAKTPALNASSMIWTLPMEPATSRLQPARHCSTRSKYYSSKKENNFIDRSGELNDAFCRGRLYSEGWKVGRTVCSADSCPMGPQYCRHMRDNLCFVHCKTNTEDALVEWESSPADWFAS